MWLHLILVVMTQCCTAMRDNLGLKDLVNVSKTYHDETKFGPQAPQRSDKFKSHKEVVGGDSREEPSVHQHTQTVAASPSPEPGREKDSALYDYSESEKTKKVWPYRTDDQYSLFNFHPPHQDEKDLDEKEYLWPSLSEYESEYYFQPREPTKEENLNQEIAPTTTAG